MNFEENINYTEELINKAALVYWKKTFATKFFISVLCVFLALVIIYLLHSKTWITASFLAVSVMSSFMFLLSYFIYRNRSLATYKAMESPVAKWTINEKHIFVESDAVKSEISWKMFKSIIKSTEVWLLIYKNNSYSVFPINDVSNETLDFINKKISTDGQNR